jgi:hypothetical protein
MSIKKHVGKIISTDQRCVVVFMQLPDDKEKALIINTEALPPRYEQMLMDVVESPEGQQEKDLANVMNRRMDPHSGRTVLAEFHARGLLRPESVDNIVMLPRPNTPFPLRSILEQMGSLSAQAQATSDQQSEVKYNPVTANQNASKTETQLAMARNLLMEAEMLQVEANKKRDQAFKIAPQLRPQPTMVSNQSVEITDTETFPEGLVITETGELKKATAGRPNKEQLAAMEAHNARLSAGGNV